MQVGAAQPFVFGRLCAVVPGMNASFVFYRRSGRSTFTSKVEQAAPRPDPERSSG